MPNTFTTALQLPVYISAIRLNECPIGGLR